MNKQTLEDLDYYRIRSAIAGYCLSEEAKKILLEREPFTDIEKIEQLKKYGSEWQAYLNSGKQNILSAWPEISSILPILKTLGATLLQEQIFAIFLFCSSAQKIVDALANIDDSLNVEHLFSLSQKIPSLESIQNEILAILDSNGNLRDLPVLRAIKTKIASYRSEIANLMKKYTSDSSLSRVLESNVPAFRADRQVLAVKVSKKNVIKGIIHEMSQTGQTVYIEPEDVVKKNNDLVQEEFHLQQEIRNIFKNLTEKLLPFAGLLEEALPIMIELDSTLACAKWGKEVGGVFAQNCDREKDETPLILQARHPLLAKKAVPIDVRFMSSKRVLIITGPNTGGKTVTLKTIALFAMLNQAGFPVLASEGTRLPIFSDIFADIGDSQSLDQSLSTFSGHMKNIAHALKGADSDSLVLLDELGSGTDPLEGSAIAMAVLDKLIELKSFVLVTTHHGILKNYGYTHESCINASVEFDDKTLCPTYHLIMGVPGESRALDIAERSGMTKELCKKARSYIVNEQADVSSLIKGLTAKHSELDFLQNEFRKKESELNNLRRKTDLHELRLRQKEMELKKDGCYEANQFLSESRKKLENLVRQIKEGEVTREKTLNVKAFIKQLTEDVQKLDEKVEKENEQLIFETNEKEEKLLQEINANKKQKKTAKRRLKNSEALEKAQSTAKIVEEKNVKLEYTEGANVLVGSKKTVGTLLRKEKKGVWSVQIGSIKMSIKEKNMIVMPSDKSKNLSPTITLDLASTEKSNFSDDDFPNNKPKFELRLIGLHTDQAIKLLEKQLDLCTMNNFNKFSIIHGKGAGVLQQAVMDYLSHYPSVAQFNFAPPEDGGTGKTYVEMKS